ncbi:GntR family transcriptional regulator [Kitasatospora cinereorecta]|uniref:GntR family transcriptional regulator n=1 Tax=Kitasatospora cinereorecta TaxID=285560 RepID=A0ABW0VNN7_9ACTN
MAGRSSSYVEIAADLRRRILAGEWKPGEQLPSHRGLCKEYGAASSTMAAARGILVTEQLLDSRPGARMMVRVPTRLRQVERTGPASAPVALPLRAQEEQTGPVGEWSPRTRPVSAEPEIAQLLRLESGAQLVETQHLFRAAGRTTRLSTCWEPRELVDGTPVMLPNKGPLAGQSVEARMASIGVGPLTVVDMLAARPASPEEGQQFVTRAGAPVLQVTRVYSTEDGLPVHVERTVVRGDRSTMLYRLPTR